MHKLITVTGLSLGIGAVCLGAAVALGVARADDNLLVLLNGGTACPAVAANAPRDRVLDWDGSDRVTLAVAGDAVYQPGTDGRLHISGDPGAIAHLRVRDGVIGSDCSDGLFAHRSAVHIVLPGITFHSFHVSGSGIMTLHGLRQQTVEASISGSGDMHADGHVDDAEIHVSGSGNADFGHVAGNTARVHVSGSGNADIAPSQDADIRISGSGDVTVHGNPAHMRQHVSGSGDVLHTSI